MYISFGTVVMNNLWNQQPILRKHLKLFISALTKLWNDDTKNVIFVTQGKEILESYPENWTIKESVNQMEILQTADVFVTHGGSNSFHEALLTKTPMAIIPFFGDQPLVAKRAGELKIGIDLVPNANIDTHSSKTFLNEELAQALNVSVSKMVYETSFKDTIKNLDLKHKNIYDLLEGVIYFDEGDLLFGTNVARRKYVENNHLQKEFTILEFKAFSELAPSKHSLPRIVDIYHDVILNEDYFKFDSQSGMEQYIIRLKAYKKYLSGSTDFTEMCIKGIEFFTRYYKIHFILNDYDSSLNIVTNAEINYVLNNEQKCINKVLFYKQVENRWRIVDYEEVRTSQKSPIDDTLHQR